MESAADFASVADTRLAIHADKPWFCVDATAALAREVTQFGVCAYIVSVGHSSPPRWCGAGARGSNATGSAVCVALPSRETTTGDLSMTGNSALILALVC